jgi:glycosyltransferase involved in cell wall biosynthesis
VKPLRLLAVIEARSLTGPAKNLLEFAQLARGQGVETAIAAFVRNEESNPFLDAARRASLTVHLLAEAGRFDRAAMRGLGALAARIQPDVMETHAVKSHFLVRLAGWPRQTAWVAFHHGYTWPDFKVRLYNQLDRWSLRTAAKVLTVSRPFARQLEAQGVRPERIEIVHNAVRPDWGREARRPENAAALRAELHLTPEARVILIVGRLSREKDHLTLVDAVSRLRPRFPVHLVIVGEGPERARIEERVRASGLENRVTLTGHRNPAEPFYGIADLAVLASRSEGSPNALLEAMAAGVPVVATAVGGVPEIAADRENALLVRPGETAGMAEALGRLLADPSLGEALAARARRLVGERYTPEERTRRLVEIYRGLEPR